MSRYEVPEEFYFRIHHVRPRFKGDIENVLIYIAEEIVNIGERPIDEFVEKINNSIKKYPGNYRRELKTINNWRTEISSLFGFIIHRDTTEEPGRRAIELAEKQDLVEFFKEYLYCFQYPGAHIKSQSILEQINAGIHFKPAQYILKLMRYASQQEGHRVGFTKAEICHCVFNDLRCTRDNRDVSETWNLILKNRKLEMTYDETGDVVRYAGDIIDYMEIANLVVTYDSRTYYLNDLEEEAIIKFVESSEWFNGYDSMIERKAGSLEAINFCKEAWFEYVNRDMSDTDFSTDILSYIAGASDDLEKLSTNVEIAVDATQSVDEMKTLQELLGTIVEERISKSEEEISTKNIGDIGECLVYNHECIRITLAGREDLVHLIKRIPTQYAVGYDINSVEEDGRRRYIEVKTTISSKPLHFNKIHLTKNEWNTADTIRMSYYVYRLMLSKKDRVLFLLQDPVGLYKADKIDMVPADGADITFDPNTVGSYEELLTCTN